MYELALVAPPSVIGPACELREAQRIRAHRAKTGEGDDFTVRDLRLRLLNAMRDDLGYPDVPGLFGELPNDPQDAGATSGSAAES